MTKNFALKSHQHTAMERSVKKENKGISVAHHSLQINWRWNLAGLPASGLCLLSASYAF